MEVDSEAIRSVGYEQATRTLELEYSSGGVYQYQGVSPRVYAELLAADSLGAFVSARIKDVYPYTRVG